jgi:replicative DNA helicase
MARREPRQTFDSDELGRTPPHSLEAEMCALGSMMLSAQAVEDVLSRIREEDDLYHPAHKEIYRAICQLKEENQAVDLVTVKNVLVSRGRLQEAGGIEYLINLNEVVPTAVNASHYATIVIDYAVLRRLQAAGHQITHLVNDSELDVTEKIEQAEGIVYSAGQRRLGKEFMSAKKLVRDLFQKVDDLIEAGEPEHGLETGFIDLDSITTGFYPGDLIILAARPAMGKTSLAMNMALGAAREGLNVAVFSLEMTGEQLIRRMLATEAQLPMGVFKKPDISRDDYRRMADGVDTIYQLPIFIDDTSDLSPLELKGKCRRLMSQGPLGMIVVDYLQLMRSSRKTENRNQEIADIARSLKQTAKELGVPILALCQVNRGVEGRDDKRPNLSDLRESGSIEAEADLVMSIYRHEYYKKKAVDQGKKFEPGKSEVAELGILKHRNGPTGIVYLAFTPSYTRFSNLQEESKEDYLAMLKAEKGEASDG